MPHIHQHLFALTALLLHVGYTISADPVIDEGWRKRLLDEGGPMASRYKEVGSHLDERVSVKYEQRKATGDGFEVRMAYSVHTRYQGDYRVQEMVFDRGETKLPVPDRLFCDNDQYTFTLFRKDAGQGYVIHELKTKPEPGSQANNHVWCAQYAYVGLMHAVDAAAGAPGSKLLSLGWDAPTGTLRVAFERTQHDLLAVGKPPMTYFGSYEVSLEPNFGWRVARRHVVDPNLTTTNTPSYGIVLDGLHFPKQVTSESFNPPKYNRPPTRGTSEVLSLERCRLTPADFYLTAFGFPEPPDVTPPARPTPLYVWLLLAASGFGVVALGCRWLLKRRAKAALPPPVPPTTA